MTRLLLSIIALLIATSCGEDVYSSRDTKYQVSFRCSLMNYQQEYSAISGIGVSQFLTLRARGAKIEMQKPDGSTITDNIVTTYGAIEFGYGGVIVGRSTYLNGDYCCFDLCCPNCEGHSRLSRLSITQSTGHATCSTCSNVYGLNNDGDLLERGDYTSNSTTRPLFQYRLTQTAGSEIILSN